MIHIPHPLGITGLVFNTAGALGLLKFAPNPYAGSPLSEEQLQSLRSASAELRRPHTRRVWSYRACMIALVIGFGLQLVDLLTT
ncbi:MAG: hypothetical protein QOF32_342 [Gammaproteobacteria bacterium]|jgi:hypothetical protein|nr:hypothetical protein [Gammaproteobacteria bacterium]